jgi:hypothetical protein
MALDFRTRDDGVERASIPVWVHLTREQVDSVMRLAGVPDAERGEGRVWRRYLRGIAEEAIRRAISREGR